MSARRGGAAGAAGQAASVVVNAAAAPAAGAVQAYQGQHWLVQLIVVFAILAIGLSLYATWTGKSYSIDLLGHNVFGDNILHNQEALAGRMAAVNPAKAAVA